MASLSAEQGLSLLKDPKFSDTTIICGDHSFKVHKVIVCSASPFFARCLEGNFREATEGSVTVGETEPFILGVALRLHIHPRSTTLGQFKVSANNSSDPSKSSRNQLANVTQALEVYELADRLLMQELRATACDRVTQALSIEYWVERSAGYHDLVTFVRRVYTMMPAGASDIKVPLTYVAAREAYEYSKTCE